uniref:NADH-ubiquinone oxidoreductase chain 4L n=1 Tax=Perumytilus purpuratus TaxID=390823 RepID=A0A346KKY8_PERPP|nr:NADH dehydrogenase subunit 4L [Perumytilus purpuratus]AXP84506.1 NADH dehydrogenase subunit 4L [Perumytilus purpuratus]
MMWFGVLLFFLGFLIALMQSSHLVSLFLGLEFMTLSCIILSAVSMWSSACFVLLVMCTGVCEASVALALIVNMVRMQGNDRVYNLCVDKS